MRDLSHVLHKHHHERVVILIDEYDTPMHAGYTHECLDEIIGFLRSFLSPCTWVYPKKPKRIDS